MRNTIERTVRVGIVLTCLLCTGLLAGEPVLVSPDTEAELIGGLALAKTSFNPYRGEELGVSVALKKPADVTVRVYDADWRQVAVLADMTPMQAGDNKLVWSGRDDKGYVVPDEAYFFTLAAKSAKVEEIYDPTTFSGGEEADLTEAKIDPLLGAIRYRLPAMARVNIRIGISGGPLMRTVVDWEPRVAGQVVDYWDGKDLDQLIDLREHPRHKMIITYFTLPASSVITYGNKEAKSAVARQSDVRPLKQARKSDWAENAKISHHYRIPRAQDRSPKIQMEFPNQVGKKDEAVVLKGRTLVHVDLDEESKKYFQSAKFEIVFFLDGRFYTEEETGYAPYNWVWDTSQVDEGTYLLTVNLSSFKDQIGIKTRKVKIVH